MAHETKKPQTATQKAVENHTEAAKHHTEAARHNEDGNFDKAAESAAKAKAASEKA